MLFLEKKFIRVSLLNKYVFGSLVLFYASSLCLSDAMNIIEFIYVLEK